MVSSEDPLCRGGAVFTKVPPLPWLSAFRLVTMETLEAPELVRTSTPESVVGGAELPCRNIVRRLGFIRQTKIYFHRYQMESFILPIHLKLSTSVSWSDRSHRLVFSSQEAFSVDQSHHAHWQYPLGAWKVLEMHNHQSSFPKKLNLVHENIAIGLQAKRLSHLERSSDSLGDKLTKSESILHNFRSCFFPFNS